MSGGQIIRIPYNLLEKKLSSERVTVVYRDAVGARKDSINAARNAEVQAILDGSEVDEEGQSKPDLIFDEFSPYPPDFLHSVKAKGAAPLDLSEREEGEHGSPVGQPLLRSVYPSAYSEPDPQAQESYNRYQDGYAPQLATIVSYGWNEEQLGAYLGLCSEFYHQNHFSVDTFLQYNAHIFNEKTISIDRFKYVLAGFGFGVSPQHPIIQELARKAEQQRDAQKAAHPLDLDAELRELKAQISEIDAQCKRVREKHHLGALTEDAAKSQLGLLCDRKKFLERQFRTVRTQLLDVGGDFSSAEQPVISAGLLVINQYDRNLFEAYTHLLQVIRSLEALWEAYKTALEYSTHLDQLRRLARNAEALLDNLRRADFAAMGQNGYMDIAMYCDTLERLEKDGLSYVSAFKPGMGWGGVAACTVLASAAIAGAIILGYLAEFAYVASETPMGMFALVAAGLLAVCAIALLVVAARAIKEPLQGQCLTLDLKKSQRRFRDAAKEAIALKDERMAASNEYRDIAVSVTDRLGCAWTRMTHAVSALHLCDRLGRSFSEFGRRFGSWVDHFSEKEGAVRFATTSLPADPDHGPTVHNKQGSFPTEGLSA